MARNYNIRKKRQNYNYEYEVMKHKDLVLRTMLDFSAMLVVRGTKHDDSKFSEEEMPIFKKYHPKLRSFPYMSDGYKKVLLAMESGVKHHEENNDHHPGFYKDGINEMNMFALMEMLADWISAQWRQNNNQLDYSGMMNCIETNCKRFKINDVLKRLLISTYKEFFQHQIGIKVGRKK